MAQVTDLTNQFNRILSSLVRAQYQSAFDLQNRLDVANQTTADAQAALRNAEQALEDKQKELDNILTMYKITLA